MAAMFRSAPRPRLLAVWWGRLGPAHVPVGPRVPAAMGVLPPQGPCPSPGQGWVCHPKDALAVPAQSLQQNEEPEARGTSKDLGAERCTVPGACRRDGHMWHPAGSLGGCATGCSATAVGAQGQPMGVRVGCFHGWGGRWPCRGCQARHWHRVLPAVGGRCWLRCAPPRSPIHLRLGS